MAKAYQRVIGLAALLFGGLLVDKAWDRYVAGAVGDLAIGFHVVQCGQGQARFSVEPYPSLLGLARRGLFIAVPDSARAPGHYGPDCRPEVAQVNTLWLTAETLPDARSPILSLRYDGQAVRGHPPGAVPLHWPGSTITPTGDLLVVIRNAPDGLVDGLIATQQPNGGLPPAVTDTMPAGFGVVATAATTDMAASRDRILTIESPILTECRTSLHLCHSLIPLPSGLLIEDWYNDELYARRQDLARQLRVLIGSIITAAPAKS